MTAGGGRLVDWVAAYLAALAARGAAARTVQTREAHLAHFVQWCAEAGVTHGSLVSSSTLLDYQRSLHRSGRYSSHTRRGMLSDLRAFGRWCIADGRIAVGDPFAALQLPKIPQRLPAGLFSPEQIAALCAAGQTAGPLGLRNRALLEIAAAIGLTSRELAALRLSDVDAVTGHVTVSPLERGAPRTVPLSPQASTWLRRYLAEVRPEIVAGRPDTDALFVSQHGRAMDSGDVAHVAREAAKRADLSPRRVLSVLKDSLAVQLLENGCDPRYLAALFGHADLQSVRKYQRLSVQRLQEVHRRCHPAEQGGGR